MAHSISQTDFDTAWAALKPSLLSCARRVANQDAEDILQNVAVNAWRARNSFQFWPDLADAHNPKMGRLYNWLHRILRNALADHLRQKQRIEDHETPLESLDDLGRLNAERYWAALLYENDRATLNDAELRAEVRYRLRFADLTEEERACIVGRINGIKQTRLARALNLSDPTVSRRIEAAIIKLRAVPLEDFAAPDLDHYLWRSANDLTIYHAPPATGAMLARERLAALTLKPMPHARRAA